MRLLTLTGEAVVKKLVNHAISLFELEFRPMYMFLTCTVGLFFYLENDMREGKHKLLAIIKKRS